MLDLTQFQNLTQYSLLEVPDARDFLNWTQDLEFEFVNRTQSKIAVIVKGYARLKEGGGHTPILCN